ncbi:hypothetical protein [Crateriforma conspicua]|uniref:hypothetical protein n=1 Tax=Crateriforma conspicua TaxID=2527996 RepID=UPI0011A0C8D6|nr:hypothetical protein [Crateriforma conspicua]
MTDDSPRPETPEHAQAGAVTGDEEEKAGCFPAILAATLIMGMVFCIGCGLSAWVIFGKRTEMAIVTMEKNFVPMVQQSRLESDDKAAVLEQFEDFIRDMKADNVENWQASGVLQRLVNLPVVEWGDLQAVEAYAQTRDPELADEARLQLSRLRRAIELQEAVRIDVTDALKPVMRPSDDPLMVQVLIDPLNDQAVKETVLRAKLLADRAEIPDKPFEDVQIGRIVRRQIEAGMLKGTY